MQVSSAHHVGSVVKTYRQDCESILGGPYTYQGLLFSGLVLSQRRGAANTSGISTGAGAAVETTCWMNQRLNGAPLHFRWMAVDSNIGIRPPSRVPTDPFPMRQVVPGYMGYW